MGDLGIPKRNWKVAWDSYMRLVRNPYDTPAVIDLIHALDGPSVYQSYLRLLHSTEGGREAFRQLELSRLLASDVEFAPGTFGSAYRDFMRPQVFDTQELVDLAHSGYNEYDLSLPHPVAWMARRATDVHDLWHVLTGYGADILGESCVVAFSFAQTRSWGYAAIGVGGYLTLKLEEPGRARCAIREAFVNGAKAEWLLGKDYEDALHRPLEDVREEWGIRPARWYKELEDARH